MSWDAYLIDDRGHSEGSWGYTHNCNGMIATVLREAGEGAGIGTAWWNRLRNEEGTAWWDLLHDSTGPDGAALLDRIIRGLEADPARFRAMNPGNGWGDYDSLVKVLSEMRDAVPEWPSTWSVHG